MIMLDDPNLLAAASAMTATADSAAAPDEFTQTTMALDSIHHTVADSLKNMNLTDLKAVVTGDNTLLKDALSGLLDIAVAFIPKLLGAILVLWVGFKLIKLLKRGLNRLLTSKNAEPSLTSFLTSFVDVLMKVLLIIMAMDIIGVKATSFIAILGALGLAVGMALQGTLQNFAGGVIILLLRPFRVGEYIECGSYKGYVKSISIFNTTIRPFNGRNIIVPNSDLATKSLINHTRENVIRLDLTMSVAYGTDLAFAKKVIFSVIDNDPLIQREPVPKVCVSELNSSSVDFSIWIWLTVEDYWTVWMRIREDLYNAFNEYGIAIPFPQMDVHLNPEPVSPKKNFQDDPIPPVEMQQLSN